jgi:hypothetical protein
MQQRPVQGQSPVRLLSMVFFAAIALWAVLTVILVLSPSSDLAKFAGAAGILAAGSFFALLGGLISTRWEHARGSAGVQPGDTGFRG